MSEVLDADYEAAGTCSEDLHVHAFNPVSRRTLLHPKSCRHYNYIKQHVNCSAWLAKLGIDIRRHDIKSRPWSLSVTRAWHAALNAIPCHAAVDEGLGP